MTRPALIAASVGALCLAAIAVLVMLRAETTGGFACRRVLLTDSVAGGLVQGAEDMALDPLGGRLILSAYDRRNDKPGGLYAVALDALLDPGTRRLVAERLAPAAGSPALRPHGLGLGAVQGDNVPLAVIERKRRVGNIKDAVLQAYVLSRTGLAPAGAPVVDPLLCNANDLLSLPEGGYLVTADRSACDGVGRRLEDIFGLFRGRVLSVGRDGVGVLASGIGFANGIQGDERHVYVAATRDHALLVFDRGQLAGGAAPMRRLPLDGAPDNLAWGDDGALYIAAHRSLLRFALFRVGLASASVSAIYRYDPAAGEEAQPILLGRVGGGEAVSGATVALAARNHIVLGAGFDAGISVCSKGGAS
jgi:hypothetical protein